MTTAPVLCGYLDMSALTGRVLMRCGWPERAHANSFAADQGRAGGLITDHAYIMPVALDDMPPEIWEPLRKPPV